MLCNVPVRVRTVRVLTVPALRSRNFHLIPIHSEGTGRERKPEGICIVLISESILNKGLRQKQGRQLLYTLKTCANIVKSEFPSGRVLYVKIISLFKYLWPHVTVVYPYKIKQSVQITHSSIHPGFIFCVEQIYR